MKDLLKAIRYHEEVAKESDRKFNHELARKHREMAQTLKVHLMVNY